jgi:hypothetical protein
MYYGWGPTKHEYPVPRSMKEAYGYDARLVTEVVSKKGEGLALVLCLVSLVGFCLYMGGLQ